MASMLPNIFCQVKYFLGTRIPGSTTISTWRQGVIMIMNIWKLLLLRNKYFFGIMLFNVCKHTRHTTPCWQMNPLTAYRFGKRSKFLWLSRGSLDCIGSVRKDLKIWGRVGPSSGQNLLAWPFEVVFHYSHLPFSSSSIELMSFSIEFIFHWGILPLRLSFI